MGRETLSDNEIERAGVSIIRGEPGVRLLQEVRRALRLHYSHYICAASPVITMSHDLFMRVGS